MLPQPSESLQPAQPLDLRTRRTPRSCRYVIRRNRRASQQADKNRVSWVTDGRIVVRHANGSWSFQASDNWAGRSARPLRPGGAAVHAEGRHDVRRRPQLLLQAGAGEDGRVRALPARSYPYEWESDSHLREPLAELPGARLVLKGTLVEYMPTFLVDPGAGRDSRV